MVKMFVKGKWDFGDFIIIGVIIVGVVFLMNFLGSSNDFISLSEFNQGCFDADGAIETSNGTSGLFPNGIAGNKCYCPSAFECRLGSSEDIECPDGQTCVQYREDQRIERGISDPFAGICLKTDQPIIYHNQIVEFSCE